MQEPPPTMRVLVTDDSAPVRAALCELLAPHPRIDVVGQAANGAEAIELARELLPDVVLIDMRMPVLDGLAASRVLVTQEPAPRIVMLSVHADPALVEEAMEIGIARYLVKGAPLAEIVAAVLDIDGE